MNVGLVLSGGVGKGAYQAGFLKALHEEIVGSSIQVKSVSSSSIGIFSGYAFCANKLDFLWDYWSHIHFDSTVDLMYNVWFKHFLRDAISELALENDELKIPMYSPICYLPFIHMDYCKLFGKYCKKWRPFMLGAVSYPFLSGGIHLFRKQIAFDGGAMDNIPVFPLLKNEQLDLIIVLHFEAGYKPRKKYLMYGIPILDYDISIKSLFRKHSFDFHNDTLKARLIDGYTYGKETCSLLFAKCNTIDEICKAADEKKKAEFLMRMDNVTFETWVQRLNEIFYPFISQTNIKVRELKAKNKKVSQSEKKVYADETLL